MTVPIDRPELTGDRERPLGSLSGTSEPTWNGPQSSGAFVAEVAGRLELSRRPMLLRRAAIWFAGSVGLRRCSRLIILRRVPSRLCWSIEAEVSIA